MNRCSCTVWFAVVVLGLVGIKDYDHPRQLSSPHHWTNYAGR
jgi:hypothetical protein